MKKIILCLCYILFINIIAPADPILVSGHGQTEQEALRNAFVSAVEQVVGVIISSTTYIENGELIKENILTKSEGFIESYEKINVINEDGLVKVTIKADVSLEKIRERVGEVTGTSIKVDGKGLYADTLLQKNDYEYVSQNLQQILDELRVKTNQTLKISPLNVYADLDNNNLIVDVEITEDGEAWYFANLEFVEILKKLGAKTSGEAAPLKLTLFFNFGYVVNADSVIAYLQHIQPTQRDVIMNYVKSFGEYYNGHYYNDILLEMKFIDIKGNEIYSHRQQLRTELYLNEPMYGAWYIHKRKGVYKDLFSVSIPDFPTPMFEEVDKIVTQIIR